MQVEPTRLPAGGTNAVGKMLGIVGDEWTCLVANEVLLGARSRAEVTDRLPVSNFILSSRLHRLETEQMLVRRGRGTWAPTSKLVSLWGMLVGIWDWERRWVPGREEALDEIRHATCGEVLVPVVTCRACHAEVVRRSVQAEFGPSGAWSRSVPEGGSRRRWTGSRITTQAGLYPEAMSLFGNRWSAALLGASFMGLERYADFEVALGAPPVVVSARLHQFVSLGIMAQSEAEDRGTLYHLTDKGWEFHRVVLQAMAWAQHWYTSPEGLAVLQRHEPCGSDFRPRIVCRSCREVVLPEALDVRRRPPRR